MPPGGGVVTPLPDTGIDCAIISVTDCSQLGHLGMVHLTESVINTDRSEAAFYRIVLSNVKGGACLTR